MSRAGSVRLEKTFRTIRSNPCLSPTVSRRKPFPLCYFLQTFFCFPSLLGTATDPPSPSYSSQERQEKLLKREGNVGWCLYQCWVGRGLPWWGDGASLRREIRSRETGGSPGDRRESRLDSEGNFAPAKALMTTPLQHPLWAPLFPRLVAVRRWFQCQTHHEKKVLEFMPKDVAGNTILQEATKPSDRWKVTESQKGLGWKGH